MKTAQREAITKHGEQLLAIFTDATETDPVKLCKKLRRLERKAANLALQNCNVGMPSDIYELQSDRIMLSVDKVLNYQHSKIPVFHNGDPRGYSLKINDEYVREHNLDIHRDWGGYGIIAPEITGE